jgi:hypothetical protein
LFLQCFTEEGLVLKDQLKEGSVYIMEKFDLYGPRKSYRSVPLRTCFTLRTVLTPPENFPMFAYTVLLFSMLSDCIDQNILLSGTNMGDPNIDLFLYSLFFWAEVVLCCVHLAILCIFTDVVGLVNKVTDVFPPSGNAKSQKRQKHITDDRCYSLLFFIFIYLSGQPFTTSNYFLLHIGVIL